MPRIARLLATGEKTVYHAWDVEILRLYNT